MNIYTKTVERILHLNLQVRHDTIEVTSIEGESGETYRMVFSRGENRIDMASRIGEEVLSWVSMMEDEFDSEKEDGE